MLSDENRNQYTINFLDNFGDPFPFLEDNLSEIPDIQEEFDGETKTCLHDSPIYKQFLLDILRNYDKQSKKKLTYRDYTRSPFNYPQETPVMSTRTSSALSPSGKGIGYKYLTTKK